MRYGNYKVLKKIFRNKTAFFAAILTLLGTPAWACAVCFSDPKSREAKGIVWGVLVLLAFITFVLTGIAAVIFSCRNRARKLTACKNEPLTGLQL